MFGWLATAKYWLAGALAGAVALVIGWLKWRLDAARDKAHEAEQRARQAQQRAVNARTAKQVYREATKAAETVRQKPPKPIDTEKRNDFDTDW